MRFSGKRAVLAIGAALLMTQLIAVPMASAVNEPAAPAQPKVVAGNASAKVTWVAPANNGSPIDSYTVTPIQSGMSLTPVTFNSTAITQTITSLTNGVAYTFKVKAHNANGFGLDSVASAAVTVGTPVAPATPLASPGSASAKVSWVAPVNNGAAVSAYTVTPYIGGMPLASQTFMSTATTQTLTGLTNGSVYTFKVKASNARGTSPDSLPSAAIIVGAPATPAPPTIIPGNASARVTWVAPANNGGAIDQYTVTPFIGAVAQPTHVYGATAVTQVITGLTNGTTYSFRVKAHNTTGYSPNSAGSLAVIAGSPAAPALPKVAPGAAEVRVNWTAPLPNGSPITGYKITPFIGAVAQPTRTYGTLTAEDVTMLTNGTTYKFKVAAVNARGTGPASVLSAAVTPSANPTLRSVANATIGQSILVDQNGMTVYLYVPDGTNTTSAVTGPLRTAWPYVTWGGAVTVGTGLTLSKAVANLQPDGTRLISYNGHLLYTFVTDHMPGQVTGQGVANFFVLDANGNKIP